jgi:apolipoprotein N-acyltransferase
VLGERRSSLPADQRIALAVAAGLVLIAAISPVKWWVFALAGVTVGTPVAFPAARRFVREAVPLDWLMVLSALVFQLVPVADRLDRVAFGSAGIAIWTIAVGLFFVVAAAALVSGNVWLARLRLIPADEPEVPGTLVA